MEDIFTPVTVKLFSQLQNKNKDILTDTSCGYLYNTILNDDNPDPISNYTVNNISEAMINKTSFKILRNMYSLPKMSIGSIQSSNDELVILSDDVNVKIYKADDLSLKQISLIRDDELNPSSALKEIFILGILSHPNIINIKSFMLKDDSVYLLFDRTITDLNTLIHQNNRDISKWKQYYLDGEITEIIPSRINYARDLLQGLNYMHKTGILHRDIKPENLLIMPDDRLCICDFNNACVLLYSGIGIESEKIAGDLQYTDINILTADSKKTYNQYSDLWSAACTILEMITSIPLVIKSSVDDIISDLELVLNSQLICIDNIVLRSVLLSMLSFNSKLRITSEHALYELNRIPI